MTAATSEQLQGDSLKAISFLSAWHAAVSGYPTLTAIHVDPITGKKGKVETKVFPPNTQTQKS